MNFYLFGHIDEEIEKDFYEKTEEYSVIEDCKKWDRINNKIYTVNLYINSDGGSVASAISIINRIKTLSDNGAWISAYIMEAGSASMYIALYCKYKYMYSNGYFYYHEGLTSIPYSHKSELTTVSKSMAYQDAFLDKIYKNERKEDSYIITAKEALKLKLIDEIV